MFDRPYDVRLNSWIELRNNLNSSTRPFEEVQEFWNKAPFIPFNRYVDPYNQQSWPTPWEILEENKYDDFTKSLMIAWTLKLSNKFHQSSIELHTVIDKHRFREYNLIYVDGKKVLNYDDTGPIDVDFIPGGLYLQNMVIINTPR